MYIVSFRFYFNLLFQAAFEKKEVLRLEQKLHKYCLEGLFCLRVWKCAVFFLVNCIYSFRYLYKRVSNNWKSEQVAFIEYLHYSCKMNGRPTEIFFFQQLSCIFRLNLLHCSSSCILGYRNAFIAYLFSISSVASFSCVGKSTHRIKTDTRFGFPGLSCTNYVAVCMRPSQSINFLYVSNSEYRRCLQNGRHSIDTTQYCWRKRVIQWRKMPLLSFNSILLKRAQIYVPYCIVGALQWTRRWLSL